LNVMVDLFMFREAEEVEKKPEEEQPVQASGVLEQEVSGFEAPAEDAPKTAEWHSAEEPSVGGGDWNAEQGAAAAGGASASASAVAGGGEGAQWTGVSAPAGWDGGEADY